jgi:hypothetical protein
MENDYHFEVRDAEKNLLWQGKKILPYKGFCASRVPYYTTYDEKNLYLYREKTVLFQMDTRL